MAKPPYDVEKALDQVIGKQWREDAHAGALRAWRNRLVKWTGAALLAILAAVAVVAILEANRPRPAPPSSKPVQVLVLPAQGEKNPATPEGVRDRK
jgi:hypothetical protein